MIAAARRSGFILSAMSQVQLIAKKLRNLMGSVNEPANVAIHAMASLLEDYGVEPADALDIATAAYFETIKSNNHGA